jgi:hypothetical protein
VPCAGRASPCSWVWPPTATEPGSACRWARCGHGPAAMGVSLARARPYGPWTAHAYGAPPRRGVERGRSLLLDEQAAHRAGIHRVGLAATAAPLRLAYADPPLSRQVSLSASRTVSDGWKCRGRGHDGRILNVSLRALRRIVPDPTVNPRSRARPLRTTSRLPSSSTSPANGRDVLLDLDLQRAGDLARTLGRMLAVALGPRKPRPEE